MSEKKFDHDIRGGTVLVVAGHENMDRAEAFVAPMIATGTKGDVFPDGHGKIEDLPEGYDVMYLLQPDGDETVQQRHMRRQAEALGHPIVCQLYSPVNQEGVR